MTTTIEDLEKRVAALERETHALRDVLTSSYSQETPAERAARMQRDSVSGHAELVKLWEKAMEQMGIRGEPIGAERLQEMIAACGIKPEDNVFSREIIEMREE